jgi:hypothetical protein
MGWMDEIGGALAGAHPQRQFDHAVDNAPPSEVQAGLASAMRSEESPPFGDIVGQLFGRSDDGQKAGVLNQILASLGPGALSGIAGGVLGRMMAPGQARLTPDQASRIDPSDAAEIAAHAEKVQPGIVEEVAGFYSQHASLIKTIGGAALAITLAKMKQNASR